MASTAVSNAWTSEDKSDSKSAIDKAKLVTENNNDEEAIYDSSLLLGLDLSQGHGVFNPPLSVLNPGDGLRLRPLQLADYSSGFLQLLGQLTKVGEISEEQWEERFRGMKRKEGTYFITVLEDIHTNQVVGAATLVVEQKFIHGCSQVGRVEDVVVSDKYRGRQLGKLMVSVAIIMARKLDCYKVTLNCTDQMTKFYNGLGFKCEDGDANFMVIRL
eukprot:TRINITY_DN14538_c0_g1_i2.p1 TRINITY_DN14538_c0_g1~~TRINITY_DN14538_c0_g1_i2.p1  ORF type:complete len:216 (-),score=92.36 TRINITY_DN14538_c0_g1_i2:339-986(-)